MAYGRGNKIGFRNYCCGIAVLIASNLPLHSLAFYGALSAYVAIRSALKQ
jgi:hypothetical protein